MSTDNRVSQGVPRFLRSDQRTHHSDRLPPVQSVEESFLSNRIRIQAGGRTFWIVPTATMEQFEVPAELKQLLPLHYLPAWNPGGDRYSFAVNESLHERVGRELPGLLASNALPTDAFREAVAVARDIDWFEHGWAVQGLSLEAAHRFAVDHDQYGVLTLTDRALIFTPRIGHLQAQYLGWRVVERERELCPLHGLSASDQVCHMHGGPFTSASMAAAGMWQEHRRIALHLLGCGSCANGEGPVRVVGRLAVVKPRPMTGPAITLREVMVASRFGSYCWGSQNDFDNLSD